MLNVFLGFACNFSCSYCLQTPQKNRSPGAKSSPEEFVRRVAPFIKAQQIKQVAYWGGEPVLYLDKIKAIHRLLAEEGLTFNHIQIATNGSLLTPQIVTELNEMGAYVVLSQHPEFGEVNWPAAAGLNNSSISYLFSHQQLNAWDWFKELDALEHEWGRPWFGFMHWMRATPGVDSDYRLTMDDLPAHFAHLYELADARLSGNRHAYNFWQRHLEDWRAGLQRAAQPRCYGNHHIDVDMDGNRYACHHTVSEAMKLGAIDGPGNPEVLQHVNRFFLTKECQACELRSWCGGACHLSEEHAVECQLSKGLHQVLLYLHTAEGGEPIQTKPTNLVPMVQL